VSYKKKRFIPEKGTFCPKSRSLNLKKGGQVGVAWLYSRFQESRYNGLC